MPLIVIMEGDETTRMLVASVLKTEGYEVLAAKDGLAGLELVRQHQPDLVISDIQMPVMDGFAMLQALRADPVILATPVIFLTSQQGRAHIRIGMTSGADDCIAKPFRLWELLDAAAAQLNKRKMHEAVKALAIEVAVQSALEDQKRHLSHLYEKKLACELSGQWPVNDDASRHDEQFSNATVLFVEVLNYARLAEKLSSSELSDVIRQFYTNASDTVRLFGARHMQVVWEGLLVVFVDSTDTMSVNHGLRAVRAALGLIDAARRVQEFLNSHFFGRGLPRFKVNVALNSGPVALAGMGDSSYGEMQIFLIGDTVRVAWLLQKQAQKVGWQIVASAAMLRGVAGRVTTRDRALVWLHGRQVAVDAVELVDMTMDCERFEIEAELGPEGRPEIHE